MRLLIAWVAAWRNRSFVPALLVVACSLAACGHYIAECGDYAVRPTPHVHGDPEYPPTPRWPTPVSPALICPEGEQTGASLRLRPRRPGQGGEPQGAVGDLLFVNLNRYVRLATGEPRLTPIVEVAPRQVIYRAEDSVDDWHGLARFNSVRLTSADLSPDGTRVVYSVCHRQPGETGIGPPPRVRDYERDVRSSAPDAVRFPVRMGRVLHEISVWQAATHEARPVALGRVPTWSPDGERLAFLSEHDYDVDFPTRDHGSGRRRDASASEDREPELRLYVMAPDGSGMRGLAPSVVGQPRWSPDGERLAYISGAGPPGADNAFSHGLHVVTLDGSHTRQLATDVVSPVAWSPDGQRLAFAKAEGPNVALYRAAISGDDTRRVAIVEGWQPRTPFGRPDPKRASITTVAWSPDGSMLLYACGRRICVVGADGEPVGTSAVALAGGTEAVWSPDGTRIAVVSRLVAEPTPSVNAVAYSMAPSGHDVRVLLQLAGGAGPHAVGARLREIPDTNGCRAGVAVPSPAANAGLVADCEILLRLQDLLSPQGMHWSHDQPMTAWRGVTVGGEPRRVRSLGLPDSYGLTGLIPSELGQLAGLEELRLGGNHLGGDIPPELGRLSRLRVLDLRGNNIGGSIPPELGQLTNLEELLLDGTYLSGPIPPELGRLANLRHLDLSSTHLSGGIPPDLGGLTQATFVRITGQRSDLDASLGGSIPPELGRLAKLEFLDLSHSGLTGGLPPELGQLANLEALDLSSNGLSGSIPPGLGQMAHLTSLDLAGNRLSGRVPPELGQLTNLRILTLNDNELTGSIPATLSQLPNLVRVSVDGNQVSGCLPPELAISKRAELGLPDCEPAT